MTTVSIVRDSEISLNGVRFFIVGPVRRSLVSIYAEKQIIGDVSRDTHPRESVLSLTNWPGGIGLEKMEGTQGVKRAWWSTSNIRHKVLTLPPLVTQTADQSIAGTYDIILADYHNGTDMEVYAAFGTSVRRYNNSTDSWGSQLHALPAAATDAIQIRLGGTNYLIFAHTVGYTFYDGATFTDDTQDTKYLAYHDGAVWGIDANGALWFATVLGTETTRAQLPLPNDFVTDLFTSRAPDGSMSLYAMTKGGLWIHDQTGDRWVQTELNLPLHPRAGRNSAPWRDALYIPAGLAVYHYQTFENSVAVRLVGPDLDDGLPRAQRGEIRALEGSHNELLALVDGATTERALTTVNFSPGIPGTGDTGAAMPFLDAAVTSSGPQQGESVLLGWDGRDWQTKWLSDVTVVGTAPDSLLVSEAYDTYRAWWNFDQRVYFMDLPTSIVNPSEITNFVYGASSTHEWPWFDADDEDATKLALRYVGTAEDLNADETFVLAYILDYGTTEVAVGTISANGRFAFDLPSNGEGVVFRAIRTIGDLARGATNTFNTPKIRSLDLVYRKKLPLKWGFDLTINTRGEDGGQSPLQLRQAIITAAGSGPKVRFNYKDESQGELSFLVDVIHVVGLEKTGLEHGADIPLSLVEV